MTLLKTMVLSLSFLGISASYAKTTLPSFPDYLVAQEDKFNPKEKPAAVDLSSYKDARTYRTKLRNGAQKGPNFAGHYTIVQIGCGTQCQENWIVDAHTGKILDRFSSMIYTKYELDSTLLILNPPDATFEKGYKEYPDAPIWAPIETVYQSWNGSKFEVLYKDKWTNIIKTAP